MSLTSLDFFTGIGGMVRAMEGISTPLLYCEISETRQRVLEVLMRDGKIPRAPLIDDIRTFCWPSEAVENPGDVDIVIGSWPCKGFAVCGPKNAFANAESVLFYDFANAIDKVRPKLVFQENVPGACGPALDAIIERLQGEYDLRWMVVPAYTVGSPQVRKRWYCLGVRRDVHDMVIEVDCEKLPPFDWSSEQCPRLRLGRVPRLTARLSMLGNAVVPFCARTAFLSMFSNVPVQTVFEKLKSSPRSMSYALCRPTGSAPLPEKDTVARHWGCCIAGKKYLLRADALPEKPDLALVLGHDVYESRSTQEMRTRPENIVHRDVHLRVWGTPRGGALGSTQVLTRRSATDLCTQLRFEKETPSELRKGRVNPDWFEWLMGFPGEWTRTD